MYTNKEFCASSWKLTKVVDFPVCDNLLLCYDAIKVSVKADFYSLFTVRKKEKERQRKVQGRQDQVSHPTQNYQVQYPYRCVLQCHL